MTADEVVDAALVICTDLGQTVPAARSVYYRRIGIRQAQVFSLVTAVDPDYFGVSQTVALVAGSYTLSALVPKAEQITEVRVALPGSSGHQAEDRVNLVLNDDYEAHLAPRATIRDQVLKQVGTDLSGDTSVTISYAKRPAASSAIAKATAMELPEQFQDLLVLDLARLMIRKLLDVEPGRRDGWVQILGELESDLLASLTIHVRGFVGNQQRRFRPPSAPVVGGDNA